MMDKKKETVKLDSDYVKHIVVKYKKYLKIKDEESKDLLNLKGFPVYLNVGLENIISKTQSKPLAIALPYPFYNSAYVQICLIVRDSVWKKLVLEEWSKTNKLPVLNILTLKSLKNKYSTFASKRNLLHSADLFLCDEHIIDQVPRLLGKLFIAAKKLPIGVKLSKTQSICSILRRLQQTFIVLRTGTTIGVKIGYSNQSEKEIYNNLLVTAKVLFTYFRNSEDENTKKNRIKCIHLVALNCPSLTIYRDPKFINAASCGLI